MSVHEDFKNTLLSADSLTNPSAPEYIHGDLQRQARRIQFRRKAYTWISFSTWIIYFGAIFAAIQMKLNNPYFGIENTTFLAEDFHRRNEFFKLINFGAIAFFLIAIASTVKLFLINRKYKLRER